MSDYPPNSNPYGYPTYTTSQGWPIPPAHATTAPAATMPMYGTAYTTTASTHPLYTPLQPAYPTQSPYGQPQYDPPSQYPGAYTSYAPSLQFSAATTGAGAAYPYSTAPAAHPYNTTPTSYPHNTHTTSYPHNTQTTFYPPSTAAPAQRPYSSSTTPQHGTGSVASLVARFGQSIAAVPTEATDAPADHRPVYILSFRSPLFKSHWALWVPKADVVQIPGGKLPGTLIHVHGDLRDGFEHQFLRGNLGPKSKRGPRSAVLGYVHNKWLTNGPESGEDMTAYNTLEQVALSVPAPGGSLNSAQSDVRPLSSLLQSTLTARRPPGDVQSFVIASGG